MQPTREVRVLLGRDCQCCSFGITGGEGKNIVQTWIFGRFGFGFGNEVFQKYRFFAAMRV
jgi:hypothetical protein